ncbi:MAG TPA: hypothetical protein VKB54_08985 [Solirubrobacteraceae bacterium]|jgi:hypothetical protein|nr:hypothetical protein [Solirubrobacteraceae bacterium]
MYRKLLTLTATAAVAATALAPAAGAADAPAPKLKVEGAYLYVDHEPASHQDFVRLVFRTASPLPRRFDGMIRAGASIEGVGHSVATARKGTTIYTVASEIKGGSIATTSSGYGKVVRKGAKVGRTFTVRIETRDGQSVTKKLVLRAERKGDDSGKPLVR